ncbi:hypothetical protein DKX38_005950 [Salix brachista]|uniref:Uncharacterized protein n=1 Tax=Salix brachista TaxID=2182728 RepID=A0A5N5N2Y4_9ROSI|nr:hypothetical protein DKX38_005950 [Salix brachista]
MGRSPCCDKVGLKKGPWTPEEDQKLLAFIEEHGHGSWRALPAKADRVWNGKDVSYDHLRVFGCKAFVHIPKDERSKLDVKTRQCIFLGYGLDEFGYRLYDPVEKKLVRSRDVVFMEDQTIHDIEKTEKVVPRYSDCLIDLDSSSLIDLPAQVEHDVQNDFQVPDDTDVPLQDESHDQLPVPEIPPDVPPRRSTRDRHPSTRYSVNEYHWIRDTLNDKLLTLEKIHTDDNGSDMLTKALTREKLETCLQRCGKSCRLRWTNYLRSDINRGKFSQQEEQTIIQLHALLGNRWSAIATHLPKRTDNEIKNYWNTHLKKRLAKMGIDPVTHKPKNDALLSNDGQTKNAANLSHVAQWESARLEAEARLVRESKLRSRSFQHQPSSITTPGYIPGSGSGSPSTSARPPRSLDALKDWNDGWSESSEGNGGGSNIGTGGDLESQSSTLTFSENAPPVVNSAPVTEFVGTSGSTDTGIIKEKGEHDWKSLSNSSHLPDNSVSLISSIHDMTVSMEVPWNPESSTADNNSVHVGNVMEEGFTHLLLNDSAERSLPEYGKDSDHGGGGGGGTGSDYYEDNKNYWNRILNLVNSSPI